MEGKMVSLNPLKGGRFSLVRNIEEKILVVAKAISELSSEIEKSRNECWKDLRKGSDKEWKESSDKCQAKWDEVLDALGRAVVFSNSRVIDDWFEDLLFQESYRNQFERDPDEEDPNRDTRPMWEKLGFSSEDHMMKTYEMRGSIEKALVSDARFKSIDNGIGYGQAHIQYTYEGDEYVIILKMCSGKELGGKWIHSKCASGEPPMI